MTKTKLTEHYATVIIGTNVGTFVPWALQGMKNGRENATMKIRSIRKT